MRDGDRVTHAEEAKMTTMSIFLLVIYIGIYIPLAKVLDAILGPESWLATLIAGAWPIWVTLLLFAVAVAALIGVMLTIMFSVAICITLVVCAIRGEPVHIGQQST